MIDLNNDAISEIDGVALEDLKELEDMRHKLIGELSRSIAVVAMEMGLVLGMVSERGEEWVVKPQTSAVLNSPWLARKWCRTRNRMEDFRVASSPKRSSRRSSLSNMRAPTSACPKK